MTSLKKVGYTSAAMLLGATQTFAAINAGPGKVDQGIIGNSKPLDQAVMGYITTAMTFLSILAVCYGLYGGFLMLTAGGEEERVKKGRTILVQVATGLLVIALAYSLVSFVVSIVFSGN